MAVLLTIVLTIVFFGGAYLMGNFVCNSFEDSLLDRIENSLLGILCWVALGAIGLLVYGFYELASLFLTK